MSGSGSLSPVPGGPAGRRARARRRLAALGSAVPLMIITLAALPSADAGAAQVSCTPTAGFTNCAEFTYSGADQTFTVPSGVTSLDVRMWGAGGGGIDPAYFTNQYSGGGGGYTTGTVAVTPGQVLTVTAGQGGVIKGLTATYGGGGVGGGGGEPGDSGGGLSALWDGAYGTNPLLMAGGGGGATNGAATTTNTITDPKNIAGGPGGGANGGSDGTPNSGGGGTQANGGAGSTFHDALACASNPTNGSQYQGGNGGASPHFEGGGGGGGGYYGGGGGRCQVDNFHLQNGAGGGGSGFTGGAGVTGGATTEGSNPLAVGLNKGVPPGGTADPLYLIGVGYGGGLSGRADGGNGEVAIQWVTQVSLSITKTASPDPFVPGAPITYTVTVANAGPSTAVDTAVSDTVPAGLTGVTWTCATTSPAPTQCNVTSGAGSIDTTANIAAGGQVVYTIDGTVPPDATSADNTATVTPPPNTSDPGCTPDCSASATPPAQAAALTVVKSALPTTFDKAGATIDYSFLVTNTGNVAISDVAVNDPLPGVTPVDCPVTTLAPGISTTCTASYVTTQADVDTGSVFNSSTASAAAPGDTQIISEPSDNTVPAITSAGLTVVKSALPTTFDKAGTTIDYSFLVTNTGNVTLSHIFVEDPLPGVSPVDCPVTTLAPGISTSCTATYVTTQADVDNGSVLNTSTATGQTPGGTEAASPPGDNTVLATPSASLTLAKSASPNTFDKAGQTIDYSFLVTNTGDVTMSGIAVNDSLAGLSAVDCPQLTLDAGRTETCTASYLTTQADVDAGSVTNSATVQGTPPGSATPVSSDPSDITVEATQTPALTMVKSASPATFAGPGQTITFSFDVTNSGNVTMSNIKIDDTLPGVSTASCPQTTLDVGQSETCTASYATTQADVDAGKIVNSATAQGTPPGSATPVDSPASVLTVDGVTKSKLELVKSAAPVTFNRPGQTITFRFEVINTGNVTMSGIRVHDALPGLSAVSCPSATLDAGKSETCTATYVTTQADVDDGTLHNTATAQGTPPGSSTPVVSPPSSVTVAAEQHPALKLVKTALPTTFSAAGQTITFSYLVTNTGNVTMSAISVNDALPGLSPPDCPQATLDAGQSETCTATYVTTQADVNAGKIVNSATAQGDPPGSDTPVDSPGAATTVTANQTASLSIVKSAQPATFTAAGQTIHYSFVVTNTGNVSLAAISVNDTMTGLSGIDCPEPVLAPGASETCTASYVTTQADVDAGSVYNSATGQGIPPGSVTPVVSPPSDNTVAGAGSPGLTLVKSALPNSFSGAGQTITFSFLVTNTGNVTMSDIKVNDAMPGLSAVGCPQTTLDVGQSETCTATYVTTQNDVNAGSLANSATAQGDPPGSTTPVDSPTASITVPGTQAPALKVVKSALPASFDAAGQTITYSFLVTNTGNVAMAGVQVNDSMTGLSAIDCPAATLSAGASETCTASYVTTQDDLDAGKIVNSATAQGTPPGSAVPVLSPPSQVTVTAAQTPGIMVTKSANPTTFIKAGTTIYYSYEVTNTGNLSLNAIKINDPMQELSQILCPATSLAPGASETCTATYVTTQADVDAGFITDYATAQGNPQGSPTPIESQPSTTTVSVVQGPAITVVKTASRSTFSKAGTSIQYTFRVSNTGNVTLGNVQVIDTSLPGLSSIDCPLSSLLPGGQETCTASYVTTKADVSAGKVTNTATAEGTPPGSTSPVGSPPSRVTVIYLCPPAPKPPLVKHRVPVTG
jgi:uncharacterized repeat protein (TIGR01451 family)